MLFKKKEKLNDPNKLSSKLDKIVMGIIIGGAIGSALGVKLSQNKELKKELKDEVIEGKEKVKESSLIVIKILSAIYQVIKKKNF